MKTRTNNTPKTQPAHVIRSRSVEAALWRNETDKGTFFNITVGHGPALERLYKDGEVCKSASSFGIGDTSEIKAAVKQAREWVAKLNCIPSIRRGGISWPDAEWFSFFNSQDEIFRLSILLSLGLIAGR